MNFQPPDPPEPDYEDYWVCDYCNAKRLADSPEFPHGDRLFCSDECKRNYQNQL